MKNFRRVVRAAREEQERLTTFPEAAQHEKLVSRLMAIPKEEIIQAVNNRNPWDFERFVSDLEFGWNHKQTRMLIDESAREQDAHNKRIDAMGDPKALRGMDAVRYMQEVRDHLERQQALDKKINKLMGITARRLDLKEKARNA